MYSDVYFSWICNGRNEQFVWKRVLSQILVLPPTGTLPPKSGRTDDPESTDEDLDECLHALGSRKAAGEDSIPKEVLQSSPEVKADLFNIIRTIWREEHVPARVAEGVAVMIFKSKGSSNDTSQYRAIMLVCYCK